MNGKQRNSQRMQIEGILIYQLNNIIEAIKNNPNINDISHAQHLYSMYIDSVIRKGAVQAYDLGADYVDSNMNVYGVTNSELDEEREIVNQITTDYSSKYWRKVSTLLGRNDVLLQKYDYEPRSPLNSNYMASSTAIGIITKALAIGTRNKVRQINLHSMKIKGAAERDETKDQLLWNSVMDQNTCEVCADLDGEYFGFDDPDMPEPADACEGKDNCRCTLDVVEATSMIVYSDEEDFIE
jgi:hypothetical protein